MPPYVEHIRDVDLLVHECYFPDGMEEMAERTGHCCATPVAEVARAAGVKRLLLSHISSEYDDEKAIGLPAIRAIFPKAELAYDEMTVEF